MILTVGTHNLLDGEAEALGFADVLLLTEASSAAYVRACLGDGYDVYGCRWQRDLVIAVRKRCGFTPRRRRPFRYKLAHPGLRKVSPHRGTFAVLGTVVDDEVGGLAGDEASILRGPSFTRTRTALLVEHRVNAAFPPYKRGEALLRRGWWHLHRGITRRWLRRLDNAGWEVFVGGDPNAPEGVKAYGGDVHERGSHLDRVGSTEPLGRGHLLGKGGSDHSRLYATVL